MVTPGSADSQAGERDRNCVDTDKHLREVLSQHIIVTVSADEETLFVARATRQVSLRIACSSH